MNRVNFTDDDIRNTIKEKLFLLFNGSSHMYVLGSFASNGYVHPDVYIYSWERDPVAYRYKNLLLCISTGEKRIVYFPCNVDFGNSNTVYDLVQKILKEPVEELLAAANSKRNVEAMGRLAKMVVAK